MAYSLGNIDALYNLGAMYEAGRPNHMGNTCRQDLETAISYRCF